MKELAKWLREHAEWQNQNFNIGGKVPEVLAHVKQLQEWAAEVEELSSIKTDAHECLLDVVSHNQDFVNACKYLTGASSDANDVLYWQHQVDVLDRMKKQAVHALSNLPTKAKS